MRASPAVRAARSGLSGRRVQAVVIGLVVLVATAAVALALITAAIQAASGQQRHRRRAS